MPENQPLIQESDGIYREFRKDGWPLCPICGEDELWSPAIPATIETITGCYRCNWKPFLPNFGGNVVLLTQLYWPSVHPALQEARRSR